MGKGQETHETFVDLKLNGALSYLGDVMLSRIAWSRRLGRCEIKSAFHEFQIFQTEKTKRFAGPSYQPEVRLCGQARTIKRLRPLTVSGGRRRNFKESESPAVGRWQKRNLCNVIAGQEDQKPPSYWAVHASKKIKTVCLQGKDHLTIFEN